MSDEWETIGKQRQIFDIPPSVGSTLYEVKLANETGQHRKRWVVFADSAELAIQHAAKYYFHCKASLLVAERLCYSRFTAR